MTGIETFGELPPDRRAHAIANAVAANKGKAEKPAPHIDWDEAIESLRQMLSELYGEE